MKVDSSMFTDVDYNEETHVLTVTWKASGKTTNYYDVPAELWKKAQSAESIGKFYNAEIKGRYDTDETRAAAIAVAVGENNQKLKEELSSPSDDMGAAMGGLSEHFRGTGRVNIIPSSEKDFDGSKSNSNDEDVW